MNVYFGLFPEADIDLKTFRGKKNKKQAKRKAISNRALRDIKAWKDAQSLT